MTGWVFDRGVGDRGALDRGHMTYLRSTVRKAIEMDTSDIDIDLRLRSTNDWLATRLSRLDAVHTPGSAHHDFFDYCAL